MISKSMARSLHLEEDCFLKQFGEGAQLHGRFNFYSPCKRADVVLGLKAHADGSGYSLLLQDEEGLQVLRDGKWYTVPKNPDAIFVLMGDQMEVFLSPNVGMHALLIWIVINVKCRHFQRFQIIGFWFESPWDKSGSNSRFPISFMVWKPLVVFHFIFHRLTHD